VADTQSKTRKGVVAPTRRSGLNALLVAILFYAIAMLVIYGHLRIWPQELREGQVVPYTILSPVTVKYVDTQDLENLTGRMGSDQTTIIIDSAKKDQALNTLENFRGDFYALRQELIHSEWDEEETVKRIDELATKYGLMNAVLMNFLSFSDERLNKVFSTAKALLSQTMDLGVTDSYLRKLKQGGAADLTVTPENIYIYFLMPNQEDYTPPDLHDQRIDMATVTIHTGDVIVAKGEKIDKRASEQLAEVWPGLLAQRLTLWIGIGLVLLILMIWWYFYSQRYAPRLLYVSSVSQLSGLLLLFLVIGLVIGRLPFNYIYFAVIFAVAALSTLIVLVYDTTFALYSGLGLGILLSLALGFNADLMLYTMAGAMLPAVFVTAGSSRKQQVWFSFALGLLSTIVATAVALVSYQELRWEIFLISFIAGFAAAVLAQGLLPVVEMLTSQLTPGKLVELANPENELLRRLKREAHGTFIHSEMVADLTEEACKDINANWLFAKVGALYHDIGKLKRPGFFAENIHDLSKNPHQNLPPETSVKILRDHVTNGLEMAREERLPADLHQFIAEHHGTYLIRYFYHKAQKLHEQNPEENPEPDPKDFCYEGPIPQNRESGVVMLADVTEAVIRAQGVVEPEKIEEIVAQIVADKLSENQLIESSLTIGDLYRIKRAFCRILIAQRHHRVRYPEDMPAPVQFHYVNGSINRRRSANPGNKADNEQGK